MIHFFRDILNGPLYIFTSILSIFFIMAIIGFLMERKKLEEERKAQIAVINKEIPRTNPPVNPTPITPIAVEESIVDTSISSTPQPLNDISSINNNLEVKEPVIVFEDPDQKKE